MSEQQTIREPILRQLIEIGSVTQAIVVGQEHGFAVQFQAGRSEKVLTTAKGGVRLFASLDTVSSFVRDLGIERFEVDMTKHKPGRLRPPRPDRAAALRHARTKMRQQSLELST